MSTTSPIGRSLKEHIRDRAARDAAVRAELDRLRPFEEVARKVIRLRMDFNLSQEALAERVGTTKSAISRLESGQHAPNYATLERIAAEFGGQVVIAFNIPERPIAPPVHRQPLAAS